MYNHHPAIQHILQFFEYKHLPEKLQPISAIFFDCAYSYLHKIENTSNPEVTVALRKLLEAKDCAVRSNLTKE